VSQGSCLGYSADAAGRPNGASAWLFGSDGTYYTSAGWSLGSAAAWEYGWRQAASLPAPKVPQTYVATGTIAAMPLDDPMALAEFADGLSFEARGLDESTLAFRVTNNTESGCELAGSFGIAPGACETAQFHSYYTVSSQNLEKRRTFIDKTRGGCYDVQWLARPEPDPSNPGGATGSLEYMLRATRFPA
jgi:hypothetical protein